MWSVLNLYNWLILLMTTPFIWNSAKATIVPQNPTCQNIKYITDETPLCPNYGLQISDNYPAAAILITQNVQRRLDNETLEMIVDIVTNKSSGLPIPQIFLLGSNDFYDLIIKKINDLPLNADDKKRAIGSILFSPFYFLHFIKQFHGIKIISILELDQEQAVLTFVI